MVKKRRKDYFKYLLPNNKKNKNKKKIGKKNKTKTKVQSIGKRNALVLRTFKFEKTDDRDLKEAHNPLSASD